MRGSNEELRLITRESLLAALVDLWETKPYDKISISELTQRAGVSRMAFYRNYESKDDIVVERIRELYTSYVSELEHEGRTHYVDYAIRFFEYIATNERFMCKAMEAKFDWALLETIEDYVSSERALKIVDVDMARFEDPYLRRFATGGYLNVLKKWLEGGMAESPQEIGQLTATYIHMLLGQPGSQRWPSERSSRPGRNAV